MMADIAARAAVLTALNTPFDIRLITLDALRDEEILVRIEAVGICHTDTSIMEGLIAYPAPSVIGHEGAGTVLAIGADVTHLKVGDRVALSYDHCGSCPNCARDMPSYCHQFLTLNMASGRPDGSATIFADGQPLAGNFFGQSSFASHAIAHVHNAVRIDDDTPFEILAPLGCGVQTGAGVVFNSMRCPKGSSICITGGGTVGLSALMAAKVRGCGTIIVVDPMDSRRALALELGATHVLDPTASEKTSDHVRGILPYGADYLIDTTGITAVIEDLLLVLGAGGMACLVGTARDGLAASARVPLMPLLSKQTITGSVEGDAVPATFIPFLVDLYRQGRFPVDRLIKTYPLEQINEAIAEQLAGTCVKPVLLP